MKLAPIYPNEAERLGIVKKLGILDTGNEPAFDTLTKEAIEKLHVPIATVTIIDKDREWFKSCQGLPNKEGPREISFCGHALYTTDIFIVKDTLENPDFADNPMVVNPPHIRFYAGISLRHYSTGLPIGVFCVKDIKPRELSIKEIGDLTDLALKAERLINNSGM